MKNELCFCLSAQNTYIPFKICIKKENYFFKLAFYFPFSYLVLLEVHVTGLASFLVVIIIEIRNSVTLM